MTLVRNTNPWFVWANNRRCPFVLILKYDRHTHFPNPAEDHNPEKKNIAVTLRVQQINTIIIWINIKYIIALLHINLSSKPRLDSGLMINKGKVGCWCTKLIQQDKCYINKSVLKLKKYGQLKKKKNMYSTHYILNAGDWYSYLSQNCRYLSLLSSHHFHLSFIWKSLRSKSLLIWLYLCPPMLYNWFGLDSSPPLSHLLV